MKSVALVLLICMAAVLPIEARMPDMGDHVILSLNLGTVYPMRYEGNITGIDNGFICLNCTISTANDRKVDADYPLDICFGTGQISTLVWVAEE